MRAMVKPELCHPPSCSQASLEGDEALPCGTAQKQLLKPQFSMPFLPVLGYSQKCCTVEYDGFMGPSASSYCDPASTRDTKPCDARWHQHARLLSVKQLRSCAYIRVYSNDVRGHDKEEPAVEGLGCCKGKAALSCLLVPLSRSVSGSWGM